jgi:hypothetical protein
MVWWFVNVGLLLATYIKWLYGVVVCKCGVIAGNLYKMVVWCGGL